jgi:CO/xanthine dehydrogenase Mo-binding subunit
MAAGQIEGGVAQAIGFTLFENVVWKDGRMANNQMTNYIIPTPADIPPIRVFFEENPYAYGPGGAKGIGELPMDGAAPAILNAIENATGVSFDSIPLMPERLIDAYRMQSSTSFRCRACSTCCANNSNSPARRKVAVKASAARVRSSSMVVS